MCGISGIFQCQGRRVEPELIQAMTGSLAHRGPDGEGYVLLAPGGEKPLLVHGPLHHALGRTAGPYTLALGHRRLAIVDLTPLGRQPMGTDDGRYWITYNGEVYNAPELRQELAHLGHRFHSQSDTEVVLAAYRAWGPQCLDRFNGMFAFAVWDGPRSELFCARDRFGVKPFYYYEAGRLFLFASEIKALLCHPAVARRPSPPAVYAYLSRGRQDHTPGTFFEGVQQLPPGGWLRVAERGERLQLTTHRWWRIETSAAAVSHEAAVAGTRAWLEDSVRLALRSDVLVGSCLSGGLDSSTIVCLMARAIPASSIQTVTSCHAEAPYDERPYVDLVVAKTGVRNLKVFPDGAELWADLDRVLWHQDEPVPGTSILAQWAVMRAAAQQGIKVLLDGQGGDELLLGYPRYEGHRLADLLRQGRWRRAAREWRAWRRLHGRLPPVARAGLVRGLLPGRVADTLRRGLMGEADWLRPEFRRQTDDRDPHPARTLEEMAAQVLETELPALLHFEDRNAMAFSIEARVPFLDHRLAQWLIRLPAELKLADGVTKRVLRDAMAGELPDAVRERRDKLGFVTPENEWLRVTLRAEVEKVLTSESFASRPYWRPAAVQARYRRYCQGALDPGPTIWRCLCLERWLQRFCD